jgi:hypothetical protein
MNSSQLDTFLTVGTVLLGAFGITAHVLSLLDTIRQNKKMAQRQAKA